MKSSMRNLLVAAGCLLLGLSAVLPVSAQLAGGLEFVQPQSDQDFSYRYEDDFSTTRLEADSIDHSPVHNGSAGRKEACLQYVDEALSFVGAGENAPASITYRLPVSQIDAIVVDGAVTFDLIESQGGYLQVESSLDGSNWTVLGVAAYPGPYQFTLPGGTSRTYLRISGTAVLIDNLQIGINLADAPARLNYGISSVYATYLPVADYKQYDTRWANDYICSSYTIRQAGCAMVSVSDILWGYRVKAVRYTWNGGYTWSTNPRDLNWWLKYNGGYSGCLIYWGRVNAYPDCAAKGIIYRSDFSRDVSTGFTPQGSTTLNRLLNAGVPAIVKVNNGVYGQHWVVVWNRSGSGSSAVYYIKDPAYSTRSTLGSYRNRIYSIRAYAPRSKVIP